MEAKCQACGQIGFEMFDICDCGWENDFSLEIYHSEENVEVFSVGYELTKREREMWSSANGDTPESHYQKWIANGKKRIYKYEQE
ncbi:MAG: hypothetical protein EB127_05545 [Alphaproteobacteria bacterium]|nr:hypothetical protein [Alphaproteobacteria bacterium]